MPGDFIESCELNGMSWESYYLYFEDVESADPRDVQADVKKAIARLSRQNAWLWLGEEGKRINQVLAGINPGDNWKCIKVWYKHLKKVLAFPFEAEVSEFQERGPHQAGDIVRVIDLSEADDHYRVLVDIKKGRLHYVFPLCDLEVTDKDSPQYQPVQDYAIWFANR